MLSNFIVFNLLHCMLPRLYIQAELFDNLPIKRQGFQPCLFFFDYRNIECDLFGLKL